MGKTLKPLDFVKYPSTGEIGLVKEISARGTLSVCWLSKHTGLYSAWWSQDDLEYVNNLAVVLATELCHPMGEGKQEVKNYYT